MGAAVGGLLAGRLVDRLPNARIAMAGAVVIALSLILAGQQSSILGIQLVYLTLGLFGFSCLYGPLLTAVTGWFDRRQGLALGIVASGGVLGQAAVPPIFQALVAGYGWRQASVLLGCGYLVVILSFDGPDPEVAGKDQRRRRPVSHLACSPDHQPRADRRCRFVLLRVDGGSDGSLVCPDHRSWVRLRGGGADDDDPDAGRMGRPHRHRPAGRPLGQPRGLCGGLVRANRRSRALSRFGFRSAS